MAIDAITQAPFLSKEQKHDIVYNSAARFRPSQVQIDKHHRR